MAKARKQLSNKTRFEVFKRDGFNCVYCGKTPPNVTLEADHIIPVSKGGKNTIENLVTSCFECNRGKGANELTSIPEQISKDNKERAAQYKAYVKFIKDKESLNTELVDMVCLIYEGYFEGYTPNAKFRDTILDFINKIGYEETARAMRISCSKMKEHQIVRYFCGICWNVYKNR